MEFNLQKIIISGIVFAIVAQLIHSTSAFLFMDYYLDEAYFSVWSKIMMPGEGAPPAEFYYYSIGFGFVTGVLYAFVYNLIKSSITAEGVLKKGLSYSLVLYLIGGIPGYLSMYLLINLPSMLLFWWSVEGLVVAILGGIVIAWVNK